MVERVKLENKMLTLEFSNLKQVTESWLAERDTLVKKIIDLENKIADIKKDSSLRAAYLEDQLEIM